MVWDMTTGERHLLVCCNPHLATLCYEPNKSRGDRTSKVTSRTPHVINSILRRFPNQYVVNTKDDLQIIYFHDNFDGPVNH